MILQTGISYYIILYYIVYCHNHKHCAANGKTIWATNHCYF